MRLRLFCLFFLAIAITSFSRNRIASWYGKDFNGKTTASGYIYDENDLTCASNSYRFGTVLRVTNIDNLKSVIVVVTDTGSFDKKYGRHIDLSKKAFSYLEHPAVGLLEVKIDVIDDTRVFKYKKGNPKFRREEYVK